MNDVDPGACLLQDLCKAAGLSEQPLLLLMHDSQLGDASLLEALHDLLSTGNTTGLFATYEMDQIVAQISEAMGLATDERVSDNKDFQRLSVLNISLSRAFMLLAVFSLLGIAALNCANQVL